MVPEETGHSTPSNQPMISWLRPFCHIAARSCEGRNEQIPISVYRPENLSSRHHHVRDWVAERQGFCPFGVCRLQPRRTDVRAPTVPGLARTGMGEQAEPPEKLEFAADTVGSGGLGRRSIAGVPSLKAWHEGFCDLSRSGARSGRDAREHA